MPEEENLDRPHSNMLEWDEKEKEDRPTRKRSEKAKKTWNLN